MNNLSVNTTGERAVVVLLEIYGLVSRTLRRVYFRQDNILSQKKYDFTEEVGSDLKHTHSRGSNIHSFTLAKYLLI